ncbi:MAG: hypothetical protein DLM72_17390 [Candidatus Nitrosopolaris wilkensis]|nr:MAG: hypothetical protein DLM72_17390 [Candidatus Nitrosopolaris wilkensis]
MIDPYLSNKSKTEVIPHSGQILVLNPKQVPDWDRLFLSVVEAHDGKIWAENNLDGKGTTLTFSLPVT